MIGRVLVLVAGLAGGAGLSQFPEYSQQYTQRLGGAVAALGQVVADFDASANASGLSREAALAQMTGTDFLTRRRADMAASFGRHARLSADLAVLEGQGPFMRAYHAARLGDREVTAGAWRAFEPALPLNFAGLVFGGVGLILGLAVARMLQALVRLPGLRLRNG